MAIGRGDTVLFIEKWLSTLLSVYNRMIQCSSHFISCSSFLCTGPVSDCCWRWQFLISSDSVSETVIRYSTVGGHRDCYLDCHCHSHCNISHSILSDWYLLVNSMLQLYNYYSSFIHFQCRIRRRKRSQTNRALSDDLNPAFTVLFPLSEQVQLCRLFSNSAECMARANPSTTTVVLHMLHAAIDLCNKNAYVYLSVKKLVGQSTQNVRISMH